MTDKTTTGSDAVDLLPCPFCGGTNIDPAEWSGNDGKSGPGCGDCGALAETARDWNRRALIAQARAAAPAHVEYDRIVKADERAMRAADALGGMGFTYDDEIGWLPPKNAAAPALPQAAHSFLMSQDLYQFLTNAQNGIDSPATCSSANRLLVWLDKARDALATPATGRTFEEYWQGLEHDSEGADLVRFQHIARDAWNAAQEAIPAKSPGADIGAMVSHFLGWPLPASLTAYMHPGIDRPIGTHLMNADEARAMFEYCLAAPAPQQAPLTEEPKPCRQCDPSVGFTCEEHGEPVSYEEWAAENLPEYHGGCAPTWEIVEANVRTETLNAWNAAYAIGRGVPAPQQATLTDAIPKLDENEALRKLAFRTLWLAYVWNDHNFDAAHREARATCEALGIGSFDEANAWIESINNRAGAASAVTATTEWVDVNERLPEPQPGKLFSDSVLIVDMDSKWPNVRMSELNFDEDGTPTVWSGAAPTHWKPAPAMPDRAAMTATKEKKQ